MSGYTYTKEMHLKKKLKEYKLTDEEAKIILQKFTETKEDYYRTSFLTQKPVYMSFKEIIEIIGERNGIKIELL